MSLIIQSYKFYAFTSISVLRVVENVGIKHVRGTKDWKDHMEKELKNMKKSNSLKAITECRSNVSVLRFNFKIYLEYNLNFKIYLEYNLSKKSAHVGHKCLFCFFLYNLSLCWDGTGNAMITIRDTYIEE